MRDDRDLKDGENWDETIFNVSKRDADESATSGALTWP